MDLVYAVIFRADAWRLFRADVEIASFNSFDLAARAARRVAITMSESGFPTELLLQNRFGELRSERFAANLEHGADLERPSSRPSLSVSPSLNVH